MIESWKTFKIVINFGYTVLNTLNTDTFEQKS